MKKHILISKLMLSVFLLSNCNKSIEEPAQKANGSNVVYLRLDENDEYLLDTRSKVFHNNTASNIDDKVQGVIPRYYEENSNNRTISVFTLNFKAEKPKKAKFQEGFIKLNIDKSTQLLDSSFVRTRIDCSSINFSLGGDNPRRVCMDSIIDYKIIKWDQENKTFTFSANGTYNLLGTNKSSKTKIYFYLDIKY